jgi:hypothetical protein
VVAEPESEPVAAADASLEEPEQEPQPENWVVLAQQTLEQLERDIQSLHRVWDRHSYAAWLAVMQIIPRVRAFKEHVGGDAFYERCRKLCRIGKTAAGNIVRWGVAEPRVLAEIWERVHAETHAASVRGERYAFPSLNKMCGWYKPEDEATESGAGSAGGEDADDEDDTEANDTRSTTQLRAELLTLEDDTKKLTRRAVTAEQRLHDTEDELAEKLVKLSDANSSLADLREQFNTLKLESAATIARKDDEIADRDEQIARLFMRIQPEPPEPPPPANDSEPPTEAHTAEAPESATPTRMRTIAQAVRTEIDPKWRAPKLRGGARAGAEKVSLAKVNQIAAYDLLDDEPNWRAQDAAVKFNSRTISFWWNLTPTMTLEDVLKMPEKP